jgi:hypothetical protein
VGATGAGGALVVVDRVGRAVEVVVDVLVVDVVAGGWSGVPTRKV